MNIREALDNAKQQHYESSPNSNAVYADAEYFFKAGMIAAATTVQTHQCQELRTGDCTCIHDGDAAAKVIKAKLEEIK